MSGLVLLALVFLQLPALAGTNSVTLAWNLSTDPNIVGYNIYYGGASHTYTNKISVGKVSSATIPGLVESKTYYFAATTSSALGTEGPLSSELVYTVPAAAPTANQPPTLNAINDLSITQNTGLKAVSLSDITSGSTTEIQTLIVTAVSSDTDLIPNPSITYTSPNATGSLSFTPVVDANGTAIITVTVNDGQTLNNTVVRRFTVTVVPDVAHYLVINPLSNQTAMTGQSVTFSTVNPRGGHVTYQWKFNGTNLPLATGATLTLSNLATNQAGIYSVTASAGSHGSTIETATLTVNSPLAAQLAPTTHASGQYALAVTGTVGYNYVILASTNLVDWVPVQTNTAPFTFVDTNVGSFNQRFFRSVSTP